MGNAKHRGSYAERKQQALTREPLVRDTPAPDPLPDLSALFGWQRIKGPDGKPVLVRANRRAGMFTDRRGRSYQFDGVALKRHSPESEATP